MWLRRLFYRLRQHAERVILVLSLLASLVVGVFQFSGPSGWFYVWLGIHVLTLLLVVAWIVAVPAVTSAWTTADQGEEAIRRAIKDATSSIDILDSFFDGLGHRQESLEQALLKPGSKVRLRVLLFRKSGRLAEARGVYSTVEVDENVQACIRRLAAFKRQVAEQRPEAADRIEWRVFDRLVPGPMVLVDGRRVFAGTFLQTKGSQHTPLLELRVSSVLLKVLDESFVRPFVDTFNQCWSTGMEPEL